MPNIDYEIHVPLKGGGHLVARGNVCEAKEVPAEEDAAEEEPVKFQVGDLIVTTESAAPYFRAGDVGVVISKTYYDLYVNFNNQDNPEVFGDGCWYVDLKYAQKVAA